MDDPFLVRPLQALRDPLGDLERLVDRNRVALRPLREILPLLGEGEFIPPPRGGGWEGGWLINKKVRYY